MLICASYSSLAPYRKRVWHCGATYNIYCVDGFWESRITILTKTVRSIERVIINAGLGCNDVVAHPLARRHISKAQRQSVIGCIIANCLDDDILAVRGGQFL